MQSPNTGYIERLDHLRFFAAALVIVFHTTLYMRGAWSHEPLVYPLFEQGHVGVQLFMVISGFILGVITFRRRIRTPSFYYNRVLRIYPLFVFVVALGYTNDFISPKNVSGFLIALLPISNLARLNYGEFGGQLWSIAIELQFYLLFPVLARMLRVQGMRYLAGLVALLVLLRAAVFYLHGTVHYLAYFTLFGALDVFVVGYILAQYYCRWQSRPFEKPRWLLLAFVGLNLVVWLAFKDFRFFHVKAGAEQNYSALWIVWPDIIAVVCAFFLVSYLQCALPIPFSRFLARLGKYSYSMYLWHALVIAVVLHASGRLASTGEVYAVALLIVLPATAALSALSYHVIEKPFLIGRVTYILPEDSPADE